MRTISEGAPLVSRTENPGVVGSIPTPTATAFCPPSIANGTASALLLKLVSTAVEALSQQSEGLIRKVFVNEFPFIIAPTIPRCVVAT